MIGRKRNLSEELVKMKALAGIITESDDKMLNESSAHLQSGLGLLLKVDDSTKSDLESYPIPEESHGEEMTRLPNDKLHVTLTSIAGFKGVQDKKAFETLDIALKEKLDNLVNKKFPDWVGLSNDELKEKLKVGLEQNPNNADLKELEKAHRKYTNLKIPQVILGDARFVYRGDSRDDRRYLRGGKTTYVVAVKNQDELRKYVDAVYDAMEMDNPEPNRFFHVTVANNAGGDSFQSIGNVDEADFQ